MGEYRFRDFLRPGWVTGSVPTREFVEYDTSDGTPGYIGLWFGTRQIAAAIRQDDAFEKRSGYRWQIWTTTLAIFEDARPLAARDEKSARAWLGFMADLYESEGAE